MSQVSQLPEHWRRLGLACSVDSERRAVLFECARDLAGALDADHDRDGEMLAVALRKITQVVQEYGHTPSSSPVAPEAVELLYDVWATGLCHGVRPADWAGEDLPRSVVNVLLRAHRSGSSGRS